MIKNRKFFILVIILVSVLIVFLADYFMHESLLNKINLQITKAPHQNDPTIKKGLNVNEMILNDESWSEIFNASKAQLKINPEILLKTIKFMILETEEDDPKLIEFVKSLINPPSDKTINLKDPARQDFSQHGEGPKVDIMLGGMKNGFLIEAGALDGEMFSNSLFFERNRGWSGILIEPSPTSYEILLSKNRKMYSINACIARKTPMVAKFKNAKTSAISGRKDSLPDELHGAIGNNFEYIYVPCFSLNTILKAINVNQIDFFSMDLEGGEWDVLSNLDLKNINFKSFLIEYLGNVDKKEKMTKYLTDKGYILTNTDHSNIYLIHKDFNKTTNST